MTVVDKPGCGHAPRRRCIQYAVTPRWSSPSLPRERERAVGREGRSEARPGWGSFLAPPPDTPFAFAHDVPPSPRVPRGRDQEVTPVAGQARLRGTGSSAFADDDSGPTTSMRRMGGAQRYPSTSAACRPRDVSSDDEE